MQWNGWSTLSSHSAAAIDWQLTAIKRQTTVSSQWPVNLEKQSFRGHQ